MSNLMSERKARRLAARVARDAAFIARVRQVSRTIENEILDRRALLARHLEDAESTFKEHRHGPRTCSNYVDPHPAQAAHPTPEVGRR